MHMPHLTSLCVNCRQCEAAKSWIPIEIPLWFPWKSTPSYGHVSDLPNSFLFLGHTPLSLLLDESVMWKYHLFDKLFQLNHGPQVSVTTLSATFEVYGQLLLDLKPLFAGF